MGKRTHQPKTTSRNRRTRSILRPDPPPYPDDPERVALAKLHAQRCDEIWAGHAEVVLDAMRKAYHSGKD